MRVCSQYRCPRALRAKDKAQAHRLASPEVTRLMAFWWGLIQGFTSRGSIMEVPGVLWAGAFSSLKSLELVQFRLISYEKSCDRALAAYN